MCNLYSLTKGQSAILALARAMRDTTGNLPLLPGIYPDYPAPIVRHDAEGERELAYARWGMPSSKKALLDAATKRVQKLKDKGQELSKEEFAELLKVEPDKGTTNVRRLESRHWQPWLGVESRCLVPFTAFSEPSYETGKFAPAWFALAEDTPLAFFAGVTTRDWTCVRSKSKGVETCDLFGFLTTDPNAEVAAIHPKAMPVILTEPDEIEAWMTAPWEIAKELQRPLPDGALVRVPAPSKDVS